MRLTSATALRVAAAIALFPTVIVWLWAPVFAFIALLADSGHDSEPRLAVGACILAIIEMMAGWRLGRFVGLGEREFQRKRTVALLFGLAASWVAMAVIASRGLEGVPVSVTREGLPFFGLMALHALGQLTTWFALAPKASTGSGRSPHAATR